MKLRWEQAKLHERVTIDQFDFDHHKSRKEQKNRILTLLDLGFVHEHMDVVLIGNPGTGKTFLAKCIATAACNANIKVLFTSAMEMVNHLIAADADRSLLKNSTIINLRPSSWWTKLGIFPSASRDQASSSRLSVPGTKEGQPF